MPNEPGAIQTEPVTCCSGSPKEVASPSVSLFRRGGWILLALPIWGLLYAVIHRASEWMAFRLAAEELRYRLEATR